MVTPRPQQSVAVARARKALRATRRALVVMATGLGKTITSALIWNRFVKGRGLFLVHNNGILDVAIQEYRKVFGSSVKFGVINGHSKDIAGADIVFATFQSMGRRLNRFPRNYFGWMTVDETHHSQAQTYRPVIEHFSCPRLGITATPDRADLLDIRGLFGEEVVSISLEEAIAKGWLPRIEYHLVTDQGFDEAALEQLTREVLKEGKRLSLEEINRRVFIRARDTKVAQVIEGYNEKAIIFCRNIEHAEHFRKFLKLSEVYHSGQTIDQNREVLENLRNGIARRILAVNAFNEGMNVPDVGLVVFYRATESDTIFRQQLGRGLRPGKDKLVALDFVGNLERIQMLRSLTDRVAEFHERTTPENERSREGYERDSFHLSGKGFEFTFADKIVDLMKIIDRTNVDFYPTWQEAAEASARIGITKFKEYRRRYLEDPQLPSAPDVAYRDWPGYPTFFGRQHRFYPTWQEAADAIKKMGICSYGQYLRLHKKDPKLPYFLQNTYEDYPGFAVMVGRPMGSRSSGRFYKTWQEAGKAAHGLGIGDSREYKGLYKKDCRLPSNPNTVYLDFPGWMVFLGNR